MINNFNTGKQHWKKSLILSAILATLTLSGCGGDDGADGVNGIDGIDGAPGAAGTNGIDGTNANTDPNMITSSGFTFPADAIFVLPHAVDGDDITDELVLALFEIPAGSTVVMPKGNFIVSETIAISAADNITLTGHGINETTLDFTNASGDDAIRFEGGVGLSIRDFSVLEANKNGIKVVSANGVYIAYTGTIWNGPLEADNGAYGLYPLQSQNVIVEHNYAYGSADAGIYVGQSNNIVIRENVAKNNVAGIEIENSTKADVYDNVAIGNTGGILAFDLPGLTQGYGGNIRIFNNEVMANNAENVGSGAVGIVPPGTGALIFSVSDVEVYNNNFINNETSAIEIASYFLADDDVGAYPTTYGATMTNGWSPLTKNIHIHDNSIARSGANPRGDLITEIVQGYTLVLGQTMPAILYGGIGESLSNAGVIAGFNALVGADAAADGVNYDPYTADDLICAAGNIDDNSAASALEFPDVNIGVVYTADPTMPALAFDKVQGNTQLLNCSQPRLEPAVVTFRGKKYGCNGDDAATLACAL
ncbi:MAG: parallel beta-helix domain-containing protein [Cognaticolwellia sp.]